ncbi:MAG: hypothetical protein IB616_01275 [Methanosarcinales archaeon]|nr:MAG: hypothetical protein IB616_01275 [Methanosarcinales archaeon]
MSRIDDIHTFYEHLSILEQKVKGKRLLSNCNGRMGWPNKGVYFFFKNGEFRRSGNGMRVVRVGTHAVSANSKTTLWDRLRMHRGNLSGEYKYGGNHRGSIFRLHVGTAIIRKECFHVPTWGVGSSAKREISELEYLIEKKVSDHICSMPFLWLEVDDCVGINSMRKYIEKNSIGLLSNYGVSDLIDPPSKNWLGNYCPNDYIRRSGLWNVDHVDKSYDHNFLVTISNYIDNICISRT